MKKAKKKVKKAEKKANPEPLAAKGFEYYIDEVLTSASTPEMEARSNELGEDGWELMFVGQYGSEPNAVRVWYKRER